MEPESITRALWRQARDGDEGAYEQLFSLHTERLLIFVRARLGERLRGLIEAEDVLQEAFVAALRSFGKFEYTDEGAFLRWICRIIDHQLCDVNDYHRAQKRQVVPRPRSALTGPLTALGKAENRDRIERALLQLDEDHREVLLLRYFEGLSAEETGARMNRSPGAVRNLAARALVELGKRLTPPEGASS